MAHSLPSVSSKKELIDSIHTAQSQLEQEAHRVSKAAAGKSFPIEQIDPSAREDHIQALSKAVGETAAQIALLKGNNSSDASILQMRALVEERKESLRVIRSKLEEL